MVRPPRLLSPLAAITLKSPVGSARSTAMSRVPPPKSNTATCDPGGIFCLAA